jgi:NADP-dependent 3-hydroxy acid dehydrogenase YdfG
VAAMRNVLPPFLLILNIWRVFRYYQNCRLKYLDGIFWREVMKKLGLLLFLVGISVIDASAGRVIVVGASSGIGREVARVFCKNGYKVGGIARREEALQSLANELGENFIFKVGDVREDFTRATVSQLIQDLGGCDIFIMDAGVWSDVRTPLNAEMVNGLDWDMLLQDQLATISTNVSGFVRMASVVLDYFVKQKAGHFVGVSSVDAVRGNPAAMVYSSSKAFVSTYMQAVRSLFKQTGFNIPVTDIRPGWVNTYDMKKDAVTWWVEPLPEAAECIFNAIIKKKKVAYVKARWGLFASYLEVAPDSVYDFLSSTFDIRSDLSLLEK